MDLLTLFNGIEGLPQSALEALKGGASAQQVANLFISPNIAAIEKNTGQEMDPLYIAYMLEYVVQNSSPNGSPVI